MLCGFATQLEMHTQSGRSGSAPPQTFHVEAGEQLTRGRSGLDAVRWMHACSEHGRLHEESPR